MATSAKFARKIHHARKRLGYTQQEVAEALGISVRWYQEQEEKGTVPGYLTLKRLLAFLELDPKDFKKELGNDEVLPV